jgi:hypothetical protein
MTETSPASRLWLLLPVLALVAAAVALPRLAAADAPAGPKNLQVLPKTTSKEQVKAIMKGVSKELGVECDFCHDVPDMASDKNEHKKIAREMMKMTEELNTKWVKKVAPKAEVNCFTCHRGKEKPDNK